MPKNIVLCCDGTSNEVASDSTNVLRLYRMLIRSDRQLAYYDSGVGTLANRAMITRWGRLLSKKLDAAIGATVKDNVVEAYRFLAKTYQPGDKIYLFGFSRGAYTARAVAGLIHFLGLVRPELDGLADLAWVVYSNDDDKLPVATRFGGGGRFKKSFAIVPEPRIHFLGVWDTVSSFGWVWDFRTLPYTANSPSVDHVRHALAIDERRGAFKANLVRPKDPDQHASIKQVWFAGVHSDVGGGYPQKEAGLSKVSLEWMLREAKQLGLLVDPDQETEILCGPGKTPPDPLGPAHESLRGWWRMMELLPRRAWSGAKDAMAWFRPNCGRRRHIINGATLHVSVKARMETRYQPPNLPEEYSIEP